MTAAETFTFQVLRSEPQPTEALDVYWEFADLRLQVYRARLRREDVVLAVDPVLAEHRFTNTYRACDRVSQYLITDVIYDGPDRDFIDEFARVLLFKLFNRIDTWESIESAVGEVDADTVMSGELEAALRDIATSQTVYSAAYIMPPPRHLSGPKALRHLALLRGLLTDGTVDRVAESASLADVFEILSEVPSLGPFLAFQYTIDLCYGPTLDHDENEHIVPGPGALRGLRKCYSDFGDLTPAEVVRFTQERMLEDTSRVGVDPPDLWGREPQLIDLQNLFCEVDKYTRVARPDLSRGVPGERIKQRYRPDGRPLTAWFPPKWGLNDRVTQWRSSHGTHDDGCRVQLNPVVDGQPTLW